MKIKFTLYHPTGDLELTNLPVNWKNISIVLARNQSYHGIFRNFIQNQLEYVEEGKTYLDAIIASEGLEAQISIKIDYYNTATHLWTNIFTGVENISDLKQTDTKTAMNADDNTFIQLILNREDTSIKINRTESIDGRPLTIPDLYQSISLRGTATATTCYAMYPYDLLRKVFEILTGDDKFKSNFFGKVSDGYPEAGAASLHMITKGLFIRGFDTTETYLTVNLKDCFDNLSKIYNLGMGFEWIDGILYVRIEERSYWYNGIIVATLENATEISKEYDKETIYSGIKVGYQNIVKDSEIGLCEYNTSSEWSTPIKSIKNILDIRSNWRADGTAIEICRTTYHKNITGADEKSEYDEQIFIVECINSGGLISRTDENNTVSGYYGSAYVRANIKLTPSRILYNWSNIWATGLRDFTDIWLRWLSSENMSGLTSICTDETLNFYENEQMMLARFKMPMFSGFLYSFQSVCTIAQIVAILANPYGIIKFWNENDGAYCYGWIKEINNTLISGKLLITLYAIRSMSDVESIYQYIQDENGENILDHNSLGIQSNAA